MSLCPRIHLRVTRAAITRSKVSLVTTYLAFAGIAACDDGISLVTPGRPTLASQPDAPPGNDLTIEKRFDLQVDVQGSLKPGHPIHLTLRGTANFATKDADVRLSLPEVAAAEKSGWDIIEVPIDEQTRPHVSVRRGFEAGESFRERTTITIPEPGYYLVMATAEQRSNDSYTDRPHVVGDISGKELWLWIDEHAGRVTERFDTTLFSPDTRKLRGPRSHKNKVPRMRKKGSTIACVIIANPDGTTTGDCGEPPPTSEWPNNPPPPPPSATMAIQLAYDKAGGKGGHSYAPLPGARYTYVLTNSVTGATLRQGAGITDQSGNAHPVIDCLGPTNERTIRLEVFTENWASKVTYGSSTAGAGVYTGSCGGAIMLLADMFMGHTYMNMLKTAEGHQSAFSQPTPRQIPVAMNDLNRTNYFYSIPEVRIARTYEMVFGTYGAFVAAHEWGHMWHDKFLVPSGASNGLMRYYANCPVPHPPANKSTLPCAFGEAFADWYSVVVRGADTGPWVGYFEENFFYKQCQQGAPVGNINLDCVDDGSIVEGAVAAFLHDLTDDTPHETDDPLRFTPSQVQNLVASCNVRLPNSNSSIPYTGIDHLIYCMEGRSPYRMMISGTATTFFNTRPSSQWPASALGAAISLSDNRLRKSWLINLYSKRVGNNPSFSEMPAYVGEDPPPDPEPDPEYCPSDPGALICPT